MKKTLSVFLFLVFCLGFNFMPVKADCADCNPSNCEACGCVRSKDGSACVYANYDVAVTSCGDGWINNIPSLIPKIVKIVYNLIQIAVPIVLVVMGALDLTKGVIAQKEEDIKKGQQIFLKRLIAGAVVFFSFVIVKFVIGFVADEKSNRILGCADCFISNNCDK